MTYELPEKIMFSYLLEKLDSWFERGERRRLNDYLAGASDLGEIERRLRWRERNGYPTLSSNKRR
jgi:hypothetical protein